MRRLLPGIMLATVTIGLGACSDSTPTTPSVTAPATLRADRGSNDHTKTVRMQDECDPTTFNQALGPGSCVRKGGGVKFDTFIAQLTKLQRVPEWRFSPDNVTLRVGDILAATNTGGEVHTFTEVAQFGGGIVPFLNALAHTPNVAAECRALQGNDFVPPGGTVTETVDEAGDEKYQCCIHPWMRAVVHVAAK